jgi:hypothetical protein
MCVTNGGPQQRAKTSVNLEACGELSKAAVSKGVDPDASRIRIRTHRELVASKAKVPLTE